MDDYFVVSHIIVHLVHRLFKVNFVGLVCGQHMYICNIELRSGIHVQSSFCSCTIKIRMR